MKRVFDFSIALVLTCLLLPLWMSIVMFIIIKHGFPILYIQERIGLNGQVFNIYKFRTMINNTDYLGHTTFKNDNRIFFGGHFLRKYKLDELAQIINIFKGEMSLVGPRPTVMGDYNQMTIEQKKRNTVLPGLTGLAQISGNTSLKWPARIQLDLEYVEKHNFQYDLYIILQTILLFLNKNIDSETNKDGEW